MTLPELLIVMGIIAALAGLAVPVIGGFRKTAHQATCVNQLRALGVAMEACLSDNGGFFPEIKMGRKGKGGGNNVLEEVLLPYVDGPSVFHCPADHEDFEKTGSSYFWNHHLSGRKKSQVARFSMLSKNSQIPLINDKEAYHGDPNGTNFLFMDMSAGKDPDFEIDSK